MTILTTESLQITFTDVISARKFDDDNTHRLSHCMKAVDFVVELSDRYLFIEVKDPLNPAAPSQAASQYLRRIQSQQIDEDLKYKYRDSFLYEWASGRAEKPIHYLVLIALEMPAGLYLNQLQQRLDRILPLQGPWSVQWQQPFVASCAVFNMESWNRAMPRYPVIRLNS